MAKKRGLPSEQDTRTMEKRVRSAAAHYFGRGRATPIFEHGHWWVAVWHEGDEHYYDVVDIVGGDFGFEKVG